MLNEITQYLICFVYLGLALNCQAIYTGGFLATSTNHNIPPYTITMQIVLLIYSTLYIKIKNKDVYILHYCVFKRCTSTNTNNTIPL